MRGTSNPFRPNWLNILTVVVAFLFVTGGIIFIAMGGSFWWITNYSSLYLPTVIICVAGTVGGYFINKQRDERRRTDDLGR